MVTSIILFFSLLTINPLHAGHIAEYHYKLDGTQMSLKFIIEKEDLMGFELYKDCDVKSMTALCTARYLNQKSSLSINGEKINFELEHSFVENDHLIALFNATLKNDTIRDITIHNSCFWEFNPKFKNRIVVDIASFQSSYLLKKGKDVIHLK